MTDHSTLKMHREEVRVSDKEMLKAILDRCHTVVVGLHDEPYPYVVPMNYGYECSGGGKWCGKIDTDQDLQWSN